MNLIKKYAGIVWMFLAGLSVITLLYQAFAHIKSNATLDINKPMPWLIIITVFIPIAIGLALFGWYALNDEYKNKHT